MGSRRPRFPDMFQQHLRMHRPGPEKPQTPKEISAGKQQIVVMIAHRLSTIMHADRIYVLEKGKIIEEGDHTTLLNQKGLYYAMWRQQIGERKDVERRARNSKGLS